MFLYMFNVMVIVLEFIYLLGQIALAFFHRLVHAFKLKPKKSVAGKVVLITGKFFTASYNANYLSKSQW